MKAVTSRGEVTSQTLPLLIPGPNTGNTHTHTESYSNTLCAVMGMILITTQSLCGLISSLLE